jgi:hypothetical protein
MPERSILDQVHELSKKGLLSKKIVILKGPALNGAPVVEKSEESLIDEEGLKEYSVSELSYAPGCHHLIHTEEELGGVCVVCGLALCRACSASNLCAVCGRTACKQDQENVEEIGMVCTNCRNQMTRRNIISLVLTIGAVGLLVFLALRFIQ